MPTPFPGMDPYLERPGLWEEVHTRLIVAIADALSGQVPPNYSVAVEQRVYVTAPDPDTFAGKPDVMVISGSPSLGNIAEHVGVAVQPLAGELPMPEEVVERYLEIRDAHTSEVVTVIELLSLSNKLAGEGRQQYLRKRMQILGSMTNLVEIDLLRGGSPLPVRLRAGTLGSYRIVVSRAAKRPRADVFAFNVRDRIPDALVPLRVGDAEPILALNPLLHDVYNRAKFELRLDYTLPAVPPLNTDDATWARQLIERSA